MVFPAVPTTIHRRGRNPASKVGVAAAGSRCRQGNWAAAEPLLPHPPSASPRRHVSIHSNSPPDVIRRKNLIVASLIGTAIMVVVTGGVLGALWAVLG